MVLQNIDASGNEMRRAGDKFYVDEVKMRQGRNVYAEKRNPPSEAVGLTLANQDSINYTGNNGQPSTRTVTHKPMNLNNKKIVSALDKQDLVGSGVSGSTNILLHNYAWALRKKSILNIPDFVLGAIVLLVYNGGHSINEILWAVDHVPIPEIRDALGPKKGGSILALKDLMSDRRDILKIIKDTHKDTVEHLGELSIFEFDYDSVARKAGLL